MAKTFLKEGKVKVVNVLPNGNLEFDFSADKISVFDQVIPSKVPGKGASLAQTSAHWFMMLRRIGVPNHFIRMLGPESMEVQAVEVSTTPDGKTDVPGRMFRGEFIFRDFVAGSMWDRLRSGKKKPEDLGFPSGHTVHFGEKLPETLIEVTTKFEESDRPIAGQEALEICGMSKDTMNDSREAVLKVIGAMRAELQTRKVIMVDGKFELALAKDGEIMFIDTFGNLDENRFYYQEDLDAGKPQERSKERVRQHYRDIGHHAKLEEAKAAGKPKSQWPAIPPMPESLISEVSELYRIGMERLTGEAFIPPQPKVPVPSGSYMDHFIE